MVHLGDAQLRALAQGGRGGKLLKGGGEEDEPLGARRIRGVRKPDGLAVRSRRGREIAVLARQVPAAHRRCRGRLPRPLLRGVGGRVELHEASHLVDRACAQPARDDLFLRRVDQEEGGQDVDRILLDEVAVLFRFGLDREPDHRVLHRSEARIGQHEPLHAEAGVAPGGPGIDEEQLLLRRSPGAGARVVVLDEGQLARHRRQRDDEDEATSKHVLHGSLSDPAEVELDGCAAFCAALRSDSADSLRAAIDS